MEPTAAPAASLPDATGSDESVLLERIREALAAGDGDRARDLAGRMLEEDALALLEDLEPAELSVLFATLGDEILAELLGSLDDRDADGILSLMTEAKVSDILLEDASYEAAVN